MNTFPTIRGILPVFAPDIVRRLDQDASSKLDLAPDTLMENAGAAAARRIESKMAGLPKNIVILVGKGNNGGDALVVARYLAENGHSIHIWLHPDAKTKPGISVELNLKRLEKRSFPNISFVESEKDVPANVDVVIDGLFGTGFSGEMDSFSKEMVFQTSCSQFRFALDVPSGLNAETGKASAGTFVAHFTISFGALKTGYFGVDTTKFCGEIIPVSISVPSELEKPSFYHVPFSEVGMQANGRHKYENGVVWILAGSEGMTGAAVAAAKSAFKAGAGIVFMIVPVGLISVFEILVPEAVKFPVGAPSDTFFKAKHADVAIEKIKTKRGVVLIGPGVGKQDETLEFVRQIIKNTDGPILVDADGITALEEGIQRNNVWITPHAAEFKSWAGDFPAGEFEKMAFLKKKSETSNVGIFLKGNPALVADVQHGVFRIDYHTTHFNRAGFGDVLAGFMAAELSKHTSVEAILRGALRMENLARTISLPEGLALRPQDIYA